MPVVTLDQVKTKLGIPLSDTGRDDTLLSYIDACTEAVEDYIGKVLIPRQFTEETWMTAGRLWLLRSPVISVDAVSRVDVTPESVLNVGDLQVTESGMLRAVAGAPSLPWNGRLRVIYTAGPTGPVSERYVNATLLCIQGLWQSTDRGASRSTRAAGPQTNLQDWAGRGKPLSTEVKFLLNGDDGEVVFA